MADLAHGLTVEQVAGAKRVTALMRAYQGIAKEHCGDFVTVMINGETYVIVDLGLRMLTPRELYKAQGFPESYIIDVGHDGRKFSKSAQVKMVGNSVCPNITRALILANLPELCINVRRKKVA